MSWRCLWYKWLPTGSGGINFSAVWYRISIRTGMQLFRITPASQCVSLQLWINVSLGVATLNMSSKCSQKLKQTTWEVKSTPQNYPQMKEYTCFKAIVLEKSKNCNFRKMGTSNKSWFKRPSQRLLASLQIKTWDFFKQQWSKYQLSTLVSIFNPDGPGL